jgi:hypothetical protein
MAGFFRGNSRSEFRTHWGSGAKEPRTGIYSEHGYCALLKATIPSEHESKMSYVIPGALLNN